MGRSKKLHPRSQQLNVSLTVAEFEGLKRRAEAAYMRPVHLARTLITNSESSASEHSVLFNNGLKLLVHQLSRLGNNLNQMMHHIHLTGGTAPSSLEPLLSEIRQTIAKLRR